MPENPNKQINDNNSNHSGSRKQLAWIIIIIIIIIKKNRIFSDSNTKGRHKDYVKAKINKRQQNSWCRLFGDRDETINHMISECSKLAQNE